ncbi:SDR family NAD(P)-dependent oxidoreductase [Alteribacillus sp. HJP-4]|uniref:SDR family NAD(P)-dependent oxidoreductase n=1 Tax=Alteribacillus sp. HJP-4 TaxID=2775394 RepID=UPI0035CD1E98
MTLFSPTALQGKHALITGASGGIGYAAAKQLTETGAKITITGRRREKLEKLKEEILLTNSKAEIYIHTADIGRKTDRNELVDSATVKHGPISLLVNSAGVSGGAVVEELTQAEMEKIMHVNYTSAVLLTQKIYESMRSQKEGAIVNVSSLSGLRGTYGNTAYAASKFALIGFTHSMAVEAIPHGIRVNAVCPGFVNTEMGRRAIQRIADRNGNTFEEQMEIAANGLPSGRITEPEEVAHTIVFLLTDAAANIVGESVKISGGSVLR